MWAGTAAQSDPSLSGPEIIQSYARRFKIEVCFRTLIHLLGGFAYRFWLKSMTPTGPWPEALSFSWQSESEAQWAEKVLAKVEAFERFVNLHAMALGMLQVVALERPREVWQGFRGWFRTRPQHGYPTEQIVRLALQHQQGNIFSQSRPHLLLHQLLDHKLAFSHHTDSVLAVT